MRITGGCARGITLKVPKGDAIRPATDRLREAVFSSIGPDIEDRHVADLFAGTGSYGLEALSRGAASATFFETGREALSCLRRNLQSVLRSGKLNTKCARIIPRDVYTLTEGASHYDTIIVDPPYDTIATHIDRIFEKAINPIATECAQVLLELPGKLEPEIDGWVLVRRIGKADRDKPTVVLLNKKQST